MFVHTRVNCATRALHDQQQLAIDIVIVIVVSDACWSESRCVCPQVAELIGKGALDGKELFTIDGSEKWQSTPKGSAKNDVNTAEIPTAATAIGRLVASARCLDLRIGVCFTWKVKFVQKPPTASDCQIQGARRNPDFDCVQRIDLRIRVHLHKEKHKKSF